jgi:hypothetical protein
MQTEPTSSGGILCRTGAIVLTFLLVGCEIDSSDNLPDVPELGLFISAEANHHETEDEAQIAAAVFRDGQPINLVGGDVFEARTLTDRILLKVRGSFTGSYAASLPVDNSVQNVFFNVVHEPVEAREDRWYPVDLLNIDPGPGELVGKSATVSFPPAVTITGPAADTVYTSIDEIIDLTWVAGGEGDTMRVLSAVNCTDGLAVSTYGTVVELADDDGVDDDGLEAIAMNKFIYDLNDDSPEIRFILDAARALLQEMLNKLSTGNIDPDFLARQAEANPVNSACEIRLFLQRQRDGQFDASFDSGRVVGSRSAEVVVNYVPPVQLN